MIILNTYMIEEYKEDLINFEGYLPIIFTEYIPMIDRMNFLYEHELTDVLDKMEEVRVLSSKLVNPFEYMIDELEIFFEENYKEFEDLFFTDRITE